jgi:hypothetical protein
VHHASCRIKKLPASLAFLALTTWISAAPLMSPTLFTTDADPTSILPTLESLIGNGNGTSHSDSGSETSETSYGSGSEYIAPLSGNLAALATPSIDGTTVGIAGIRAENLAEVTEEDKVVRSLPDPSASPPEYAHPFEWSGRTL